MFAEGSRGFLKRIQTRIDFHAPLQPGDDLLFGPHSFRDFPPPRRDLRDCPR